eukprot:SAG22_NODE_337_length_12043_cov_58.339556_17_plen_39_part_01
MLPVVVLIPVRRLAVAAAAAAAAAAERGRQPVLPGAGLA